MVLGSWEIWAYILRMKFDPHLSDACFGSTYTTNWNDPNLSPYTKISTNRPNPNVRTVKILKGNIEETIQDIGRQLFLPFLNLVFYPQLHSPRGHKVQDGSGWHHKAMD